MTRPTNRSPPSGSSGLTINTGLSRSLSLEAILRRSGIRIVHREIGPSVHRKIPVLMLIYVSAVFLNPERNKFPQSLILALWWSEGIPTQAKRIGYINARTLFQRLS